NEIFTVDVIGSEGVLRTGFNRDVEIRDKQGALLDAAALGVPARESPFKAAYDEIVRYLRGGEAPQCTSRDCMPSYELAFGILESALSGCRIALPCRNRDRRFYAFRMPGLRPTTERNN
ncbi:MAG: hypothetical protein JW951_09680, partial [Lentisphaerae bacterium]|nr:hypothetical protein [Lentisphaerota bacterium]